MIELIKSRLGYFIAFVEYLVLSLIILFKFLGFETLRDFKEYHFSIQGEFYQYLWMFEFISFVLFMVFFMILMLIKGILKQEKFKEYGIKILIGTNVGFLLFLVLVLPIEAWTIFPAITYIIFTTYLFYDVFVRFVLDDKSIKPFISERVGLVVFVILGLVLMLIVNSNFGLVGGNKSLMYFMWVIPAMIFYFIRLIGIFDNFFNKFGIVDSKNFRKIR